MPATPASLGAARSAPAERAVLLAAALGTLLLPLNSTMIAVALPDIADDFGVGLHAVTWTVTAYLIAMASLHPLAGKLGDRHGRRPVILVGLAGFAAASLGAALAPSLPMLVALRVAQAVAGALVAPNAMAVVREALPSHRRASGFGLVGAAMGVAAAAGPPLGGALDAALGWRALFLVSLPVAGGALVLAARTIRPRPRAAAAGPFDAAGALLLCAVLVGGALLLNARGANAALLVAGAGAVLAGALAFTRRELAHPDPVLQPRMLRRRGLAAATAAVGLSNLAMYATLLAVPIVLEARGFSGGTAGLVLAALSVVMTVASPVGGRLADRRGRRPVAAAGLALLAGSLVPVAIAGDGVSPALLAGSLAAAGAGLGLANAALGVAAVESLAARDAGVAAGIYSTGRYLGSIGSAALVAGLLGAGTDNAGTLFALSALAAMASAVVALALPGRRVARPAARPVTSARAA